MSERLTRLRAAMAAAGLPALLIVDPANRRYLSGFTGSAGALLVSEGAAVLVTDSRYTLRAGREAPAFEVRQSGDGNPEWEVLAAAARELGLTRIGFEAGAMSVALHGQIQAALGAASGGGPPELVAAPALVEGLREVKDAVELATLRRAIALTDGALAAVLPRLTPATTERQAAWMLEAAMREAGADGAAFKIIVAAGPNGASPHAVPGDEALGAGRPVIIDMGALLAGYHADLTRTVVIGEPDARFREIYGIVLAAQQRAIGGVRPGAMTDAVDALAREHIGAAGYGEHFGHGLGHGVGLNIHEGPAVRRHSAARPAAPLRAGNVFSVEPGIYLEGWGGVRIEDLVLVTETGCEVLSAAPKLSL